MDENLIKKLIITGRKNIYNNIIENKEENLPKKRIPSLKWSFSDDDYSYFKQMKMIIDISNNNLKQHDEISKIAINEINKKISSYKQQDKLKKILDKNKFLSFQSIINKMIDCNLKCRYCLNEMLVLYDISREMNQWSVDRINNEEGHNFDNFHLACLSCNLKRRKRSDEKYLFTKQLNIIKINN
jgi:hypothetical protein